MVCPQPATSKRHKNNLFQIYPRQTLTQQPPIFTLEATEHYANFLTVAGDHT